MSRELCNKCAKKLSQPVTIDVPQAFKLLTPGAVLHGYNCSECKLSSISRNLSNELFVGYPTGVINSLSNKPEISFKKESLEIYA